MRFLGSVCLAFFLLAGHAAAHAQEQAPASERLAPLDVLSRALARWQTRPRPTRLSYTVQFDGTRKGGTYERRFRVDYTPADQAAQITEILSRGTPPPFVDPEKQRVFADETFGFVPRTTAAAPALPEPYPYDVRMIALESVDERPAYHIELTPRDNSDAFALRDMYVDAATYDVLKIGAVQTEHAGPLSVPYHVDVWYAEEGRYWLIHRVEGTGSFRAGFFNYASSGKATFGDFHSEP